MRTFKPKLENLSPLSHISLLNKSYLMEIPPTRKSFVSKNFTFFKRDNGWKETWARILKEKILFDVFEIRCKSGMFRILVEILQITNI